MVISEFEAALASVESIDEGLELHLTRLNEVCAIVDEISIYGVTKQSFDKLSEYHPGLNAHGLELSSHPIRMGADEIGNEAVGALSGIALAAIYTAIAAVLGFIISKIFGGSSSGGGGGGGGGISATTKELEKKGMVWSVASHVEMIKNEKVSDKRKQQTEINAVGNAVQFYIAVTNNDVGPVIKEITDLLKTVQDAVTKGADEKIFIDISNKDLISVFDTVVPFTGSASKHLKGLIPSLHGTVADHNTTRKNNKAAIDKVQFNKAAIDGTFPTGEIKFDPNTVDRFEKTLKDAEAFAKKSSESLKSSKITVDSQSLSLSVTMTKILGSLISRFFLKQLANVKSATDDYARLSAVVVAMIVGPIYKAIPDNIVKVNLLKKAGIEQGELDLVLKKSPRNYTEKDIRLIADLGKAIDGANIKLTPEQEAALAIGLDDMLK